MNLQEEMLILQLESITPLQFLEEMAGGAKPTTTDLKIVENVILHQKLPIGVVNVLIYYVLLRNDMKLSKSFVEKIAGHWSRKKITSVREAMALAKEEHRQYQEWADRKNANSQPTPVEKARHIAIEEVILQGISDEELGKFVRSLFEGNQ